MISPIFGFVSLVAAGAALICAALAVAGALFSKGRTRSSPAWAASACGVLALVVAVAGGSTRPLDLAAVAGVVFVGGVAGAGWAPRGRGVLLALGLLGFAAVLYTRLDAFARLLDPAAFLDQLSWGIARSAGFVAFLCATGAVVLGARRPSGLPIGGLPARVYALHRALGIAAVLAIVVHLVALWTDDFVEFTWGQLLFLPWTSGYRPFAVTLGWLAMISLALTAASGGLRRLLPGWRIVHALAYLTFALGLVHGLLAGSDSGSVWAIGFYVAALVAVFWTLSRRFSRPSVPPRRALGKWAAKDVSPPPGTPGTPTRVRASAAFATPSGTLHRRPPRSQAPEEPPDTGRA